MTTVQSALDEVATSEAERQLRLDFAAVFRVCQRNNWAENIGNHLSLMVPGEEGHFLVNRRGTPFKLVTASNLIVCDLEGNTVRGDGRIRPVAFHIHARIHKMHPGATAVLHVHSPYATALSGIEGFRFDRVFNNNLILNNRIVYDDARNGGVNGIEEGDRLAGLLGDKTIMLMMSHGVLVVGDSLANAFYELCMFERTCMYTLMAMQAGRPLRQLPEHLLADHRLSIDRFVDPIDHILAWHKILGREEPDYAD